MENNNSDKLISNNNNNNIIFHAHVHIYKKAEHFNCNIVHKMYKSTAEKKIKSLGMNQCIQ